MNALEAASLVMIPSGYENGTLGSLKPTDGTGDFTFSRGSDISATRVNEDGYIEKGYDNLLLQSNQFDTTWFNIYSTETSGQSGYDGSSAAWLITKSVAGGYIGQNISQSGVQTFSIYAKANDSDYMLFIGGAFQFFNLSNGTLGDGTAIDAKIESIGSGWYRCSMTENASITRVRIFPAEVNTTSATSGSIYIQDAMLNQGMVAYPYVETTTAPVAGGILEDMPRLDYTDSSCPSLKLEPQRTNLIEYSEYLGSNWTFIRTNYESNTATSPEGLTNAAKVFANTSSGNHYFEKVGFTGFTSGDYTYSFFAKSAGSDFVQIATSTGFDSRYQNFNLTTGEKASGDTDSSGYDTSITPIGDDGWYRLTITANAPSTSVRFLIIPILTDAARNPVFTGDGVNGFYFYGAQLEQDATYPTSYIPTNGTSQTRLVDVCSKTGVSSLIGQTEGTLFAEFTPTSNLNTDIVQLLADTALDNGVSIGCGVGNIYGSVYTDSSYRFNVLIAQTIPNNTFKVAICYKTNDFTFFVNGVKVASGANSYSPSSPLTRINFNQAFFFGNQVIDYKSVLVFPVKLSDADCITLTTL